MRSASSLILEARSRSRPDSLLHPSTTPESIAWRKSTAARRPGSQECSSCARIGAVCCVWCSGRRGEEGDPALRGVWWPVPVGVKTLTSDGCVGVWPAKRNSVVVRLPMKAPGDEGSTLITNVKFVRVR